MKKALLTLIAVMVTGGGLFASQYEFDESLVYKDGLWSFYTSFKEQTSMRLMDLGIQMSYINDEHGDIFKSHVNADFKLFDYINPFAYFSFEEGDLNYKRAGAGVNLLLGEVENIANYKVFTHKAKLSATYESQTNDIYAVLGYDAKFSMPVSDYSKFELVGIDANVQMAGYGQKYHIGSEYSINKNLAITAEYDNEILHGVGEPIFRQGLRIRI